MLPDVEQLFFIGYSVPPLPGSPARAWREAQPSCEASGIKVALNLYLLIEARRRIQLISHCERQDCHLLPFSHAEETICQAMTLLLLGHRWEGLRLSRVWRCNFQKIYRLQPLLSNIYRSGSY